MQGKRVLLHKAVYHIAKVVLPPFLKNKYSFRTDRLPELDEPYIMLSNHTTENDMFFAGMASRRHMYFVCGEHLLRNKTYGKLLRVLVDPIPLPKGRGTLKAVREILRRIKDGHNVMMFPEGKRSFHGETIPAAVSLGALVKKAGCALVTYRIRGGYFTYPRWARNHLRRGHIEGSVVGVYSSSQLAGMTAEEITAIINADTYENAYATQREKMWRYTGDNLAKGMEHYLFICPECRSYDSIETEGDEFRCSRCGMKGHYDEYGFLRGENLPYDNVLDWGRWIEKQFDADVTGADDKASGTDGGLLFTEKNVLLYHMLEGYTNEDILTAELKIYRDRMVIGGFEFPFEKISALSMLFGNILLFTYDGIYYGLTGDTFRAWKCGRLWHLAMGDTQDRTKEL